MFSLAFGFLVGCFLSPNISAQNSNLENSAYYVDSEWVLSHFLVVLSSDSALSHAYDGFFVPKGKSFFNLWEGLKKTTDKLVKVASLYPPAAVLTGAYSQISKNSRIAEQQIGKLRGAEKYHYELTRDFQLMVTKAAKESNASVVYNKSQSAIIFVDEKWDLSTRILDLLVENARQKTPSKGFQEKSKPKKKKPAQDDSHDTEE
jgi:hypothetical protein